MLNSPVDIPPKRNFKKLKTIAIKGLTVAKSDTLQRLVPFYILIVTFYHTISSKVIQRFDFITNIYTDWELLVYHSII